ncbi:hypothetical protein ABZ370_33310 [Streptomyces sp. NPDC005962]|uniref:hypothetical protein n=1 Tax=Streptomyces sp. NPDC005962 TaxID=3154466 RepID=UPI0033D95906
MANDCHHTVIRGGVGRGDRDGCRTSLLYSNGQTLSLGITRTSRLVTALTCTNKPEVISGERSGDPLLTVVYRSFWTRLLARRPPTYKFVTLMW